MKQNFWIIDVLQDLAKYAESQNLHRLKKSIEQASEEFLQDYREQHFLQTPQPPQKSDEPGEGDPRGHPPE